MKICIAAVGQRMPSWADDAVREFVDRLPKEFQIELREVKPEPRKGQALARARAAEAARLRAALPAGAYVVAMDENGRDWTSAQFADSLSAWRDEARLPAFVLGGADGLDPQFKQQAPLRLRLSSMTLPHALARVVLVEQIYRAWSILSAHPYHRS
ncbi:MAG TPA: 23S rRNA (pseudouridine(1915)-N(3))-methyltransferase RlmH [Burkholderiaceae bacterium]|nr:23S rRNA (pseudouridine(1915)-N(3))-methyltransferase RlmH [Burkholderiaceae bacterium]